MLITKEEAPREYLCLSTCVSLKQRMGFMDAVPTINFYLSCSFKIFFCLFTFLEFLPSSTIVECNAPLINFP